MDVQRLISPDVIERGASDGSDMHEGRPGPVHTLGDPLYCAIR